MTTELIKISTDTAGRTAVSGRELHEFLGIETPYPKWFDRMVEYGFDIGKDYELLDGQKCPTNNPKNPWAEIRDHAISIDMAKEVCMIQRTDKGKEARQYFIECEKKLLAPKSKTEMVLECIQYLQDELGKAQTKIESDKPKVLFSDAVATAKTDILIGEFAKILIQNGVDTGQNRLFQWLRDNGYLCSKGELYNSPTQRAMDLGLFRVKETTRHLPDGHVRIDRTTKITGKGQIYFANKLIDKLTPEVGGSFPPGYFEEIVQEGGSA